MGIETETNFFSKNPLRYKTRGDCLCLLKITNRFSHYIIYDFTSGNRSISAPGGGKRGLCPRQSVRHGRIFTCNGSDVFKLQCEYSGIRCLALKMIASMVDVTSKCTQL